MNYWGIYSLYHIRFLFGCKIIRQMKFRAQNYYEIKQQLCYDFSCFTLLHVKIIELNFTQIIHFLMTK